MIILGLFVITVMSLLFMSMLDMLVFKQSFVHVLVHLLPIYPDTSTIYIIVAAFLMGGWVDFNMTDRLKKKPGKQSNKQGSEENGDAKQN
ncbi:hypothetical protein [Paenibacillus sp. JDR-2]|uniref:hypothetical protein n=1 Tax=Paenibacillus sp. (strain JDR-2) TaxID=324057 RepID=UPI000166867A|nr:hypothetical protein [Paenibacillus sp. JDR-2]ACT01437.1 hypothetical protein Pjdr2_2784 [Paenibacillus sp. JDR-2]